MQLINQQTDSKQKTLILVAIVGGALGLILLIASAILGGRTSEPQASKALSDINQLVVASSIIQEYETSPSITNIAASADSVATTQLNSINQIAASLYPELTYVPVRDLANVRESLDSAQVSGTINSQAKTILSNSASVAINSLNTLINTASSEQLQDAAKAAIGNLATLRDQIDNI